MALSSLALRRPVTMSMFYAGVVLLGLISFRALSIDFLPPVSVPRLTIHTTCRDYSPEEMDEKIAQPLASAVGTVMGVKRTSSLSRRGTAVVTLDFSWGIDMDYAMLEVREKLDQLGQELPAEAGRPTILRVDPSTEPILSIAVTSGLATSGGGEAGLTELTETCNALLKKRLEQVEGVAQVLILGGVEREIRIELDEQKLLAQGLSSAEVAQAVSRENANLPGGTIRNGSLCYPLRLVSMLGSTGEIASVSFSSGASGRKIRLGEIASVRDTIQERSGWTHFNGREILVLQVRKEAGSNTLAVSQNVRQALGQIASENPGLGLHVLADQAEFIRTSVADVESAALWGAFLAFLVLFLFLKGLSDPFIVGATTPVSILATLVAMNALGISLNVISLTGLALGIGMLGDNAIIVIENVRRLRQEGRSMGEAITAGTHEINLAVTASTMTNVAIFLPVLFVRSVARQLFADMAVTMTVSLLASLLVAVTLVPLLLAWESRLRPGSRFLEVLSLSAAPEAFARLVTRIDTWNKRFMDRVLDLVLCSRGWVVALTLLTFGFSLLAASLISTEPAPEIDRKRFVVDVAMETGTTAPAVVELAMRVENVLRGIRGVSGVYTAGGIAANPDVWSVPDASLNCIHLEATVADSILTSAAMGQARERVGSLCRFLSGVEFAVKPGATTFERILRPLPYDLLIRVQGGDPTVDRRIATAFRQEIQWLPGLTNVSMPSRQGSPEYRLQIDRAAAARYGVTTRDVAEHLSRLTAGEDATVLSDVDRQIAVRVEPERLREKRLQDVLSSFMICNGTPVRLEGIVRCEQQAGRTEIRRENGMHAVVMTADAPGESIARVADGLRQKAASYALPPGYSIEIGGENEEMESSFRSLAVVIGLSLMLVYMILAAEYESLLYPFVILLTSPLAFIGAVLAMLLTGEKYNVLSLVGIVVMIGAVDNDAVIAVDVITALRRAGAPLHRAIRQGMRQRLRPILMTTATTVLGIFPLILSPGQGSELVRALTIPLAGGMLSSTFFTLIVIPVVYTYIDCRVARKP